MICLAETGILTSMNPVQQRGGDELAQVQRRLQPAESRCFSETARNFQD
jgi:hypothetical protein